MKIKTILPVAVLTLIIAGCSNQKSNDNKGKETTTDTTSVTKAPVSQGIPTVIDFYTDWCGPCQQFKPIFHQAEEKYSGKINFRSINVDENEKMARQYSVQYLPTIVFLNGGGQEVGRFTGLMQPEDFHRALDTMLQ